MLPQLTRQIDRTRIAYAKWKSLGTTTIPDLNQAIKKTMKIVGKLPTAKTKGKRGKADAEEAEDDKQ